MGLIRWIEKWSWILLRYWLAFAALLGVLAIGFAMAFQAPAGVGTGLFFAAPYLFLRYRDPDSPTLPFRGYLKGVTGR